MIPQAPAPAVAAVRIDAVGCNGGAPSAAAFCVNGHVDGIAPGGVGYSVRFSIVNENPGDPAYNYANSAPLDTTANPPTWAFGPSAITALGAAEDVMLTARLYQNGNPVPNAGSDSEIFTLNP
jgi:hypothetical protein